MGDSNSIRAAAEELADDLLADIRDRADMALTTMCELQGVTLDADQQEAARAGVEAGITATMVVLGHRGLIRGPA